MRCDLAHLLTRLILSQIDRRIAVEEVVRPEFE
jgi:hypothetical protein